MKYISCFNLCFQFYPTVSCKSSDISNILCKGFVIVLLFGLDLAVEVCKLLVSMTMQVGDAGPVLDMVAVMLENISSNAIIARTTSSAAYRISQIIASVPNLSYQNRVI